MRMGLAACASDWTYIYLYIYNTRLYVHETVDVNVHRIT